MRAGAISSQRLGQDIESRSRSNDVWDFNSSAVVSRSRDRQDCDQAAGGPGLKVTIGGGPYLARPARPNAARDC